MQAARRERTELIKELNNDIEELMKSLKINSQLISELFQETRGEIKRRKRNIRGRMIR